MFHTLWSLTLEVLIFWSLLGVVQLVLEIQLNFTVLQIQQIPQLSFVVQIANALVVCLKPINVNFKFLMLELLKKLFLVQMLSPLVPFKLLPLLEPSLKLTWDVSQLFSSFFPWTHFSWKKISKNQNFTKFEPLKMISILKAYGEWLINLSFLLELVLSLSVLFSFLFVLLYFLCCCSLFLLDYFPFRFFFPFFFLRYFSLQLFFKLRLTFFLLKFF